MASIDFKSLVKEHSVYHPQESMAPIEMTNQRLFIGVPKEVHESEARVCLRPEAVEILVNNGHEVWVERGAGLSSGYEDRDYSEAGAQLVDDKKEVYKAVIIVKISPPSLEELEYMRAGQMLISALQMNGLEKEYIQTLCRKKIDAIAFELLEN